LTSYFLSNQGIIDPRAWTVFGLSAKDSSNPIGYFGTGLKNAIAILLREGIDITIYRGLEEVRFSTQDKEMRGNIYQSVYANDTELPFTLQLGKNWEVWMALRELISNCRDEGGEYGTGPFQPCEGWTMIKIEGAGLTAAINQIKNIFLDSEARWKTSEIEIHERESKFVYARGVLAYELRKPSKLTYNILDPYASALTEDRTLANMYAVENLVRDTFLKTEDEDLVQYLVQFQSHDWEDGLSWNYGDAGRLASKLLLENKTERTYSPNLMSLITHLRPDPADFDDYILTSEHKAWLDNALGVCKSVGFPLDELPKVVNKLPHDHSAWTDPDDDNRLYLSKKAFRHSQHRLTLLVLEESIKKVSLLRTTSREYSGYLIEIIICLHKEKQDSIATYRE